MQDENKKIKCKPGQGKLNRTIIKAQKMLAEMGHTVKRFKRDYENGVATYACPTCGLTAVVKTDKTIVGDALTTKCTHGHGTGV